VENIYNTCRKFIQNTIYEILSGSAEFYRSYEENILAPTFFLGHSVIVCSSVPVHTVCLRKTSPVLFLW